MTATDGRRTNRVPEIRDELRASILSGDLAPDTPLSSVQLAERFGVSRTPLREAFRLLQEEGLVTMTDNHRPRVALISPDDLDAVYSQRILLSALSTSLTVPDLTPTDIEKMQGAFDQMTSSDASGDRRSWAESDAVFHATHMASATPQLRHELHQLQRRCRYFFTIWKRHRPEEQTATITDHARILDACREGDRDAAAEGMARHLHRIGSTLHEAVAPEGNASGMNAALRLTQQPS